MTQSPDPVESIAKLAAGALRADYQRAWPLFQLAWPPLERFVRVRLLSRGLRPVFLEDCGQEVFARVWKFRKSYQGASEAELWRWLRQIADNERRRMIGREAARRVESLSITPEDASGTSPRSGADAIPEGAALHEEMRALPACLRQLDSRRRQVIELAYFDPQLTERAIAELLDCSPSNVHRLKVEGLRLLAACLGRKGIR